MFELDPQKVAIGGLLVRVGGSGCYVCRHPHPHPSTLATGRRIYWCPGKGSWRSWISASPVDRDLVTVEGPPDLPTLLEKDGCYPRVDHPAAMVVPHVNFWFWLFWFFLVDHPVGMVAPPDISPSVMLAASSRLQFQWHLTKLPYSQASF